MSDFGSLRIALSALYASQRGLQTTGHNLANVNTEGYSRQTLNAVADAGPVAPAMFSKWQDGGDGVTIENVQRARDVFLEARSYLEHGSDTQLKTVQTTLAGLEQLYGEPSDTGLQQQLADFWGGWQDVANNPGDGAARTQLVQLGSALTTMFNNDSKTITQQVKDATEQLGTTVDEINTMAGNIAQLNSAIQTADNSGLQTTDLQDQRDLLVSKLSDDIGVTVRADDNGMVDVYVDGGPLVRGTSSEKFKVDTSGPTVQVLWAKDNYPANSDQGRVGGLLASINDILPRYRAGLDAIAVQLRDSVNQVHGAIGGTIPVGSQDLSAAGAQQFNLSVNGTALPAVSVAGGNWSGAGGAATLQTALQNALDTATGAAGQVVATVTGGNGAALKVSIAPANPNDQLVVSPVAGNAGFTTLLGDTLVGLDGAGGRPFFTGTDASNLSVAAGIVAAPSTIAAAVASSGSLDGHGALQVGALADAAAGADNQYRSYIVQLGVEAQSANRRVSIQDQVTSQVDSSRESVAGVNLDDEMVSMLAYQHAYEAAARFMSVVDQTLDTLINHTGV